MAAFSLRPLIALAAACFLGLAACPSLAASGIELPEMGEPADTTLSPAEEKRLGSGVVAQMYAAEYIVQDPEMQDYLNAVGWKLAASGSEEPPNFKFYWIADDGINAFALPGGFIGMNVGIIMNAKSESEMAGVLAHEQAHVTQRHIARTGSDTSGANLATWAAVLAAIVAGSTRGGDPNLLIGALAAGQSINYQRQVNYTRSHELEADRFGIQTLAKAGFEPKGMADFFARLEQQTRLYGSNVPEFLRTHPVNTTRISEAMARAASLPKVNYQDSLDFGLMKARGEVLAEDSLMDAIATFKGRMAKKDSAYSRYGYAFALLNSGQGPQAQAVLEPLLVSYPKQLNIQLLLARILGEQGQNEAAGAVLAQLLANYPRSNAVVLAYADFLNHFGRYEQAREVLLGRDPIFGASPENFKLLAESASQLKQPAESAFRMSQYHEQRGDWRAAFQQVEETLRQKELPSDDRARLMARRAELRERAPEGVKRGA